MRAPFSSSTLPGLRSGTTSQQSEKRSHMSSNGTVNGRVRALVAGALLASISVVAAPAAAQTTSTCPSGPPVLQVGNPNPRDVLHQGDYIFSGVAFDPAATDSSGITRVDLFLGDRDTGGLLLPRAPPAHSHQSD